jgi:hypothetical protein
VGTCFADTSFWIAISRRHDQYHQRAVAWHQFVLRNKVPLVTTEAVLWEWLNALSHASTRAIAAEGYRRTRADSHIEVVPFQPELTAGALELYRTRNDKDWSLTDCLSFVVMQRRGLMEALTTDRHFEQANLKPLMLQEPTL